MTVILEIPDELAACWPQGSHGIARTVLEDLAVESYRQGRLTSLQVRHLLGHGSRWETQEFLVNHDAWPATTEADLDAGLRHLQAIPPFSKK